MKLIQICFNQKAAMRSLNVHSKDGIKVPLMQIIKNNLILLSINYLTPKICSITFQNTNKRKSKTLQINIEKKIKFNLKSTLKMNYIYKIRNHQISPKEYNPKPKEI